MKQFSLFDSVFNSVYFCGYLHSFVVILHVFDWMVIAKRAADNLHDVGNDLACRTVVKR